MADENKMNDWKKVEYPPKENGMYWGATFVEHEQSWNFDKVSFEDGKWFYLNYGFMGDKIEDKSISFWTEIPDIFKLPK
jgi:hypothetical protein